MKLSQSQLRILMGMTLMVASALTTTGVRSAEESGKKPVAVVEAGGRTFMRYCALCHGLEGTGLGPLSDALQKTPPDLTLLAQRNGGVFPVERVKQIIENGGMASHGMMAMLAWGKVFNEELGKEGRTELIDSLAAYLEQIQEH